MEEVPFRLVEGPWPYVEYEEEFLHPDGTRRRLPMRVPPGALSANVIRLTRMYESACRERDEACARAIAAEAEVASKERVEAAYERKVRGK